MNFDKLNDGFVSAMLVVGPAALVGAVWSLVARRFGAGSPEAWAVGLLCSLLALGFIALVLGGGRGRGHD